MTADGATLRTFAFYGGFAALVLHAPGHHADVLHLASLGGLALMYLSLPALVLARRRWGMTWPARVFAGAFGYCVIDAAFTFAVAG